MSGDELDLENPEQLAALFNLTLSDNEDTADELASALELRAGHIDDDDASDDVLDDDSDDGQDDVLPSIVVPEPGSGGSDPGIGGGGGGTKIGGGARGGGGSNDVSFDADAGVGPDEDEDVDFADTLRRGSDSWTDMARRRARGRHTTYRLHATHSRSQPIESKFTGECQSVRVTLPLRKPDLDSYIGTYIGRVEAADHLLFSVDEVCRAYELRHGTPPLVERVDLITGARFMGRRFSPVSCYLAYADANALGSPSFFILEGGSASGKPKALYVARNMDTVLHEQSAFQFTPLSCSQNWYTGGLSVAPDGHPTRVHLTSAQERDGSHGYFALEVTYAVEQKPKRVISPLNLQIEAAMHVLAIAEQTGCDLGLGSGGGMQLVLGPAAEDSMVWDTRPKGRATMSERNRYCGCPRSGR
jgi:hypothetical protein